MYDCVSMGGMGLYTEGCVGLVLWRLYNYVMYGIVFGRLVN